MNRGIYILLLLIFLFSCKNDNQNSQEKRIQELEQKLESMSNEKESSDAETTNQQVLKPETRKIKNSVPRPTVDHDTKKYADWIKGSQYGVLGTKPIKFVFTYAKNGKVKGYNILLNEEGYICEGRTEIFHNDALFESGKVTTRPVEGTFTIKNYPNSPDGGYADVSMQLREPGTDKWDGEFTLDFMIADWGGGGSGTWKSFNGKLNRKLEICGP